MDENKFELRTLDGSLAIRESEDGSESRTIYGRAIVFNSESVLLDQFGLKFREVILPEAVTMDWLMTQDVKFNMLHDRTQTIARWNKGEGPLRLGVDDKGVTFEFDAPKCDLGDRCLELVRCGVYTGCSCEFRPDKYEVIERGSKDKQNMLLVHSQFYKLSALTVGLDPAYTETTVSVREMWRETETGKREEEEQQAIMMREREKSAALRRMREREMDRWDC